MRLLTLLFLALFASASAHAADSAERIVSGLQFPEGTVFVGDQLYFVDYGASSVYRLQDHSAVPVWHQAGCGANGLLPFKKGLLVACYDAGTVVHLSLDGRVLQTLTHGASNEPLDRPNDIATDGRGGAYFTASGGDGGTAGKIYHLPPDLSQATAVADDIQNANGIALAPDGKTLYLGESTTDKVLQFDVAADSSLTHRRDFLVLDTRLPGNGRHTPDGIRTDPKGRLYVSLYNGGGFAVFDSNAALLTNVSLPGSHHSNLALSPDQAWVYGTINDSGDAGLYRVRNPLYSAP
jgi:gluconolactonase